MISAIVSRSCGERTTAVDNDDEDSWMAALAGKSGGASDGGPKCDDVVDICAADWVFVVGKRRCLHLHHYLSARPTDTTHNAPPKFLTNHNDVHCATSNANANT